jgi:hypothetical protein
MTASDDRGAFSGPLKKSEGLIFFGAEMESEAGKYSAIT